MITLSQQTKVREREKLMLQSRAQRRSPRTSSKTMIVSFHLIVSILSSLFSVLAADRDDVTEFEAEGEVEVVDPAEKPTSSKKRKRGESQSDHSGKKKGNKKRKKGKDREYGVTRGVDFVDVSCVLNFDLPTSSRGYTHRVGRTARAGRTGMALSFVLPNSEYGKNKVVGNVPTTKNDEEVWERIKQDQAARGCQIVDYKFDQSKIESFRYRMEDALRSVTKAAIKEGRIKDLKNEVLKSDKLRVSTCVRSR